VVPPKSEAEIVALFGGEARGRRSPQVVFEAMLDAGLMAEVRSLFERVDLTAEHPSMRAVGYRQLWKFLSGHSGLEDSKKQALAATRQLAKRQLTWLRRRARATWVDSAKTDPMLTVVHALSAGGFAGWSYA